MKIESYVLASFYCRTTLAHGGVAVFVREDIDFTRRVSVCPEIDRHFEYALCDVTINDKTF